MWGLGDLVECQCAAMARRRPPMAGTTPPITRDDLRLDLRHESMAWRAPQWPGSAPHRRDRPDHQPNRAGRQLKPPDERSLQVAQRLAASAAETNRRLGGCALAPTQKIGNH